VTGIGQIAGWRFTAFAVLALTSVLACQVHAEDYPARTVKIIVPTGPSGSYDVVARILE